MLEFINTNGVLFSGVFTIITALITSFATYYVEKKREKKETIKSLQNEVEKLKSNLKHLEDKEAADKAIDKSNGSLYVETLPNDKKRVICGFCWEENNFKTPLVPEWFYSKREQYEECKCPMCERYCRGINIFEEAQATFPDVDDEDLPF